MQPPVRDDSVVGLATEPAPVGPAAGPSPVGAVAPLTSLTSRFLERMAELNGSYRAGTMRVHVPAILLDSQHALDDLLAQHLPTSQAALTAASRSLFFSLPVAFDPAESVGPYLAIADRDEAG